MAASSSESSDPAPSSVLLLPLPSCLVEPPPWLLLLAEVSVLSWELVRAGQ